MQHAWGRVLVRAARSSRSALTSARVASHLRSAAPSSRAVARCTGAVRFESTESTPSRFLSLADEEKAKNENGDEGEGEGGDNFDAQDEDSEGQDGAIEVDSIPDVNKGGVEENDELDELVMELFMENPLRWNSKTLARKFHLSKPRVEAIIWMKRMEAELTPEEFRAKVQEAKKKAQKEMDEQAKKLADAEASGNDKEAARLKKRARQEHEATQPDHELDAEEEAMVMGIDDEAFRNPDFFFLSDEFEGYPPLVRRMGKHGHTDQLYPEEALELQRLAGNNKIELHKNFASPANSESKAKFRLAVKDITTKKKHLLVRDESRSLRLATNDEVLPRTWVRRPAHFRGLAKELA
ncbi:uncharacterized protein PITG_02293 [Phytophthora infestans T30-4]|uniref:Uncharacterized protein n=1 Tax=Phytophthora infestans (strain T30-4) TaxID=403677 RepID=D0MVZ2_PHYIT|nr:uncharacterized protein PITG_02293 [Phytophthora infestans T30-4]EEY63805.1 conserved hypothetical protein [Phytophthora infestans T30-4]|eukprot:XP_002907241.1 conserved hypothetical protein [Phytophthora infestans T30-4]